MTSKSFTVHPSGCEDNARTCQGAKHSVLHLPPTVRQQFHGKATIYDVRITSNIDLVCATSIRTEERKE